VASNACVEKNPDPTYRHASEAAYKAFRDMKYGVRIYWGSTHCSRMMKILAECKYLHLKDLRHHLTKALAGRASAP
jgi:hypothetical protein